MYKCNRNFIQYWVKLKIPANSPMLSQHWDFRYLLSLLQLIHCKSKKASNNKTLSIIYLHHQRSDMVICHLMIAQKKKCHREMSASFEWQVWEDLWKNESHWQQRKHTSTQNHNWHLMPLFFIWCDYFQHCFTYICPTSDI